jgi:hypothetical protein
MESPRIKEKYTDLTPQIASDYLNFKKEYEGKDFLSIRYDIVPTYFSDSDFCNYINILRKKRMDFANKGKEAAKTAFNTIFNELLWDKIEDKRIDIKEFKKLVGTLMNAVRKINSLTDNANKDIVEVFEEMKEKKEKKEHKKREKEEQAKQKEKERIEQELIVHPELNNIFSELRSQKEYNKPVGENLTREDLEEVFTEAWKEFLKTQQWLSNKKLEEIYDKFYNNNLF